MERGYEEVVEVTGRIGMCWMAIWLVACGLLGVSWRLTHLLAWVMPLGVLTSHSLPGKAEAV